MTAPVPRRSGVRRSRSGAVLGGVCAGVPRSAGLDPLLLRVAVVAVTLLTGGAGLLAYLAAWVLIPREEPSAAEQAMGGAATAPPRVDVRAAWSAVGKDLRSLAGELRRPQTAASADPGRAAAPPTLGSPPAPVSPPVPGSPTTPVAGAPEPGAPTGEASADPPAGTVPSPRSPLEAADDAATALGERLRAPEVQAEARRAAASVTQALAASVDEVGRRVRRDRRPPAPEPDQTPDHG